MQGNWLEKTSEQSQQGFEQRDDITIIGLKANPSLARIDLFQKGIEKGKHIITTKPYGSNLGDAEKLYTIVKDKINCAVFYGRTGNGNVEQIKKILDSGEIGHLSLYKEDWLHHYPLLNDRATDPEKNGGPFMESYGA